jgi:Ser/Thr protein kinase RdoA (MazF antagonist)
MIGDAVRVVCVDISVFMTEDPRFESQTVDKLAKVACQFAPQNNVLQVQPFGNGNINDTFVVSLGSSRPKRFILQRINTQVFRQPELVMWNMRTSTQHIAQRLRHQPVGLGRRWDVPQVLLTQGNCDHWVDEDGSFWRAISFIESSRSLDTVQNPDHAREVGYALGTFHRLISDLSADALADTLEGFHITPQYLRQYDEVLKSAPLEDSLEIRYCLRFIQERRELTHVLETAKAQQRLPIRPIHGDPKVNNIMLDEATGQAVSMIDLDTVKPGLVHYDIGDCLRSGCNPLGEETEQWQSVHFEVELAQAMLQGYLTEARYFLMDREYDYLYDAMRLIAFELGLRFFADYLAGNVYFKVRHSDHNLARALVQFKLAESIEAQSTKLRLLIQELR